VAGVVVIGGGQAGLAVSHELTRTGVEHVVLEKGRIGQTWRGRWDSFCLVTPNWTIQLPGHHYAGDDPDGFLERDAIVAHLEDYAASFRPPIQEGVTVNSLEPGPRSRFLLRTTSGDLEADSVVLATPTSVPTDRLPPRASPTCCRSSTLSGTPTRARCRRARC